jgi:hypothetical protein
MTFDNTKTVYGIRIKLFIATVLLLAYVALVYAAKIIKFPLFGIGETAATLILVGIYLIVAFLPMALNYQYVWFSDEGESLVFRYFSAGIVGGRKNSVEIRKISFAGYKIEKKFFGLSRSLYLYQNVGSKTAKYPPIHISALPADLMGKLISTLNQYSSQVL